MRHLFRIVRPGWYIPSQRQLLNVLCARRALLWELSKLDLRERYVGQALGLMWAVTTPLLTMAVYLFVFAGVFQVKMPQAVGAVSEGWGGSYALYLLSGLIPWMGMQEVMARSSTIIVANASLVKQVVFPLEILPLKSIYATIVSQIVAFGVFLLYGLMAFGFPSPTVLILPFLFALQLIAGAGIALLFSAIGAYVRDLKDVVSLLCFLMVYGMPIFYVEKMIPANFSCILKLNPFYHMIVMYHDVLFYGQITSLSSWLVFPLFAFCLWLVGCKVFSAVKHQFGNVL